MTITLRSPQGYSIECSDIKVSKFGMIVAGTLFGKHGEPIHENMKVEIGVDHLKLLGKRFGISSDHVNLILSSLRDIFAVALVGMKRRKTA